jgi:hypothetical protein
MGSTNLGVPPLASWSTISTNVFAANGQFTDSIPIDPTIPQDFFIISAATSVPDTQPPSAPSGLTAAAISSSQINLNWIASTDNVGVTSYLLERSQGVGQTNFAQIATPAATNYNNSGLAAASTYNYRVRATDAAGNLSGYSAVASATTSNAPALAYPILAYGFNAGSGTTVTDASPNAITGSISGASWTTSGRYGDALSYNGTTSYVNVGNPTPLKLTGSMTLEAWVMATGVPADDGQIIAKSGSVSPSVGWQLKTSPDTGVRTFAISISPDGSSLVQRYSTTVVALNTWYHVAGVYNAGAGTLDIYVNGVLDDGALSGTVPGSQFDPSQNVLIGKRGSGWYFNGTIDELRVYNVPLTQAQIQSDMNTPVGSAADTQPPSAPSSLAAMAISSSQINLNWIASTDNVGVTGYLLERSPGVGSTNFAQIATPAVTNYSNAGLAATNTYNYRVRATDAAGNLSGYSGVASATTSNGPSSSGLVVAYGFDAGSGTTVTDASPNAITGTISGATWTTSGRYGDALSFNGTTSYVNPGNPTPLKLTGSMTLEAWVMATGVPADDGQIIAKSGSASPSVGWQFKTSADTGTRTFAIAVSPEGSSLVQRYGTTVVALNTWYHVAGVYNSSARTLDIYVNGVLDDGVLSGTVPGSQFDPNLSVSIGKRSGGWYFQGTIDEVRVRNVALTAAQIQADMNTPIGNTPTAPGNLTATAVSTNQIKLSWTASGANLGVASYLVERQGPLTTNFAQIGTAAVTNYSDTTVAPYSTYGYRVQATDGVGHTGPYSSVAQAYTGLSISPRVAVLTPTRTQQFTVNFTSAVNWLVDGVAGGSASSGTISASGLYTPPAGTGTHTVTATTADLSLSTNAIVYVTTNPGVFTHHNDNLRTGQNQNETVLSPANVNSTVFGKLFSYPVDATVYAMPLYVANVNIPRQGYHNVVYVATGHDSVYAFDADGLTNKPLWQVSFINPAAGVTTIPAIETDPANCCDLTPEVGITSTPVIDPASGTLYVSVTTKEVSGSTTSYVQRLHALGITTGAEKFGGPVVMQASVSGTGDGSQGGTVSFIPLRQSQRPGLLLSGGVVYLAFAGHDDVAPYHGWVLGYNATNLQPVLTYNATPNGSDGGIWHGGGGVAADATGSLYFVTGNGTFDLNTGGRDYGDSVEKLGTNGVVQDYFTPHDQANMNANDLDLSSGGVLLLPDQTGANPHLLISAGKTAVIYLINRDNMGHYHTNNDSQIVQVVSNAIPGGTGDTGVFTPPVYFNEYVYFGAVDDSVRAFKVTNGLLSTTATSVSPEGYTYPGGAITVSANGNTNGIVWAVQKNGDTSPGVLFAYDARNVGTELYNSTQAGSRDTLDIAAKFTPSTIVNGKVFIGSMNQLTVYGLLP